MPRKKIYPIDTDHDKGQGMRHIDQTRDVPDPVELIQEFRRVAEKMIGEPIPAPDVQSDADGYPGTTPIEEDDPRYQPDVPLDAAVLPPTTWSRRWTAMSVDERRVLLANILDAPGHETLGWDTLPYWLRRHLAHYR
jgi:hypothetical protein